ncbi:MFS transporter [Mammaliicoccus sciuri]|uniref:MFS transporter n=1 Tax=Mammaliicoccus sciuri TaxID=1296 RepID=UPI003BA1E9D3
MNRNIIKLWISDTTSLFGTSIYQFILVILAIDSNNSVFGAGLTLFFITAPYFFLGILGGTIADNFNRKNIMLFCDVFRAIIILIIPIYGLIFNEVSNILIIIVGFLVTSLRAFFYPAYQSLTPALVTEIDELGKVNSLLNTTNGLSVILGPALGSLAFIFTENIYLLLFITSLTFIISAISIFNLKISKDNISETKSEKVNIINESIVGLKYVVFNNKLVFLMLIAFTIQLLIGDGILSLALPKTIEDIELSKGKFLGYCTSMISIGSILTSIVMSNIKIKNNEKWIFIGYFLRGITYSLFVFSFSLGIIWVFFTCLLLGICFAISGPTLTTLLQKNTDSNHIGKVMSLRSTLGNVTDSFSYIIIGGMITMSTLNITYLLSTLLILIITFLLYLFSIRRGVLQ